MKPRLLDHVVCPVDGTPLRLVSWEQREVRLTASDRSQGERMGFPPESLETEVIALEH